MRTLLITILLIGFAGAKADEKMNRAAELMLGSMSSANTILTPKYGCQKNTVDFFNLGSNSNPISSSEFDNQLSDCKKIERASSGAMGVSKSLAKGCYCDNYHFFGKGALAKRVSCETPQVYKDLYYKFGRSCVRTLDKKVKKYANRFLKKNADEISAYFHNPYSLGEPSQYLIESLTRELLTKTKVNGCPSNMNLLNTWEIMKMAILAKSDKGHNMAKYDDPQMPKNYLHMLKNELKGFDGEMTEAEFKEIRMRVAKKLGTRKAFYAQFNQDLNKEQLSGLDSFALTANKEGLRTAISQIKVDSRDLPRYAESTRAQNSLYILKADLLAQSNTDLSLQSIEVLKLQAEKKFNFRKKWFNFWGKTELSLKALAALDTLYSNPKDSEAMKIALTELKLPAVNELRYDKELESKQIALQSVRQALQQEPLELDYTKLALAQKEARANIALKQKWFKFWGNRELTEKAVMALNELSTNPKNQNAMKIVIKEIDLPQINRTVFSAESRNAQIAYQTVEEIIRQGFDELDFEKLAQAKKDAEERQKLKQEWAKLWGTTKISEKDQKHLDFLHRNKSIDAFALIKEIRQNVDPTYLSTLNTEELKKITPHFGRYITAVEEVTPQYKAEILGKIVSKIKLDEQDPNYATKGRGSDIADALKPSPVDYAIDVLSGAVENRLKDSARENIRNRNFDAANRDISAMGINRGIRLTAETVLHTMGGARTGGAVGSMGGPTGSAIGAVVGAIVQGGIAIINNVMGMMEITEIQKERDAEIEKVRLEKEQARIAAENAARLAREAQVRESEAREHQREMDRQVNEQANNHERDTGVNWEREMGGHYA
ncbi:MAG: hypothetical protein KC478_13775 [Bacteriovoracaceae bacterium]|nr:hypothetical protein [Bacteriovoracaceae bacterium]